MAYAGDLKSVLRFLHWSAPKRTKANFPCIQGPSMPLSRAATRTAANRIASPTDTTTDTSTDTAPRRFSIVLAARFAAQNGLRCMPQSRRSTIRPWSHRLCHTHPLTPPLWPGSGARQVQARAVRCQPHREAISSHPGALRASYSPDSHSRGPVAPARTFSAQAAGVHVPLALSSREAIGLRFARHIYLPCKVRCGRHVTRHPAVSTPCRFGPARAAGCHAPMLPHRP